MSKKQQFRVVCSYDTETTTILDGSNSRAFACLYIFDDLRGVDDFKNYVPGESDDIRFYRTVDDALSYIYELVVWGQNNKTVPVIAAYNLAFDLQTLQRSLSAQFDIAVNAQSSTSIYTYDLVDGDTILLRFWDTFFFDMRGLKELGKTAGLPKAIGDWDYSLVRTPETPLSDKELYYAGRDTQIIPAYLKYLLDSNEWMDSSDFGVRIITKTSIVRQMAKKNIGGKKITLKSGKKMTLTKLFGNLCEQEFAPDYQTYAMRKACFRGGLTFTAAATAATVQRRVTSLDVTSMHHTFITGCRVPVRFKKADPDVLNKVAETVIHKSVKCVLNHYNEPFANCFNGLVKFTNLRLKKGTVFDKSKIAVLAEGKFSDKNVDDIDNERSKEAYTDVMQRGWHDSAYGATFAFGKLYKAEVATVFLTEIELWNVAHVYDFDSMEVLAGEYTTHTITPPDYVTLQTNILFEMKNDAKKINKLYSEGTPYTEEIPDSVPKALAEQLKEGSVSEQSVEAWYTGNVKGMFNSIYGTQAQDLMKPEFCVDENGDMHINPETKASPENYEDREPDRIMVFYNYGARIVGRSRMHLVIAMILIDAAFGSKVRILGGDTDSMKISLDPDVEAQDLIDALQPLHEATTEAINITQARVRALWPNLASNLTDVGCFDIEPAVKANKEKGIEEVLYWDYHYEAWNKARVSMVNGHSHITCAGLSRKEGTYTVENLIDDLYAKGHSFEELAPLVLGYNTTYDYSICQALAHTAPKADDFFDEDVTDYLGNTVHVHVPMAKALYPSDRTIGDTLKFTNAANIAYLNKLGRHPYDKLHRVSYDGQPFIEIGVPNVEEVIE